MIDLHCHTTNSDGTWSTMELLKIAQDKGITTLSITDHDTVGAHYDTQKIKVDDYYKGKLIVGVEINCVFNKTKIELLGYGFKKEPVQKWLDSLYGKDAVINNMLREFNDMIEICKHNNVKISEEISYDPKTEYPIDVIYFDVIKYSENKKLFTDEIWNSKSLFFRKCTTDKEFILFRDFTKDYPDAKNVSEIIRSAGGKVFLAHLFVYELDNYLDFLKDLKEANVIDGVECYYSRFTQAESKTVENFCNNNNLLKSGGSDCHGEKYQDLELGTGFGNLIVKAEAINEWI